MTSPPWRTLRQARKNARLSTAKLAELSGVSHSYISFLERGERGNPSPEIVQRLADALGCAVADIAYRVDPDPTDIVARVRDIAAAQADLGARVDSLMADLAQEGEVA